MHAARMHARPWVCMGLQRQTYYRSFRGDKVPEQGRHALEMQYNGW